MFKSIKYGDSSFVSFVLKDHREQVIICILGMIIVFSCFKIIYPYPSFMPDSYFYIMMASKYSLVPLIWPVGYSWFIRTLHFLTSSPFFFVLVQYILLQAGSFFLSFTLFYIVRPFNRVKNLVFFVLTLNPAFLYLSNQVASDAVFASFSFFWIAMLIHMIVEPRKWLALVQGLFLAYLFTVRHQAMYYPLLMLIALIISNYSFIWKVISGVIGLLLIFFFFQATKFANGKETGIAIFTGFSGLQLANNALYMYPYVKIDTSVFKDTDLTIDRGVRTYFDTTGLSVNNITPFDIPVFLLDWKGPLKYYQFHVLPDLYPDKHSLWYYHRAGVDFNRYANKLIVQHPIGFARYFLFPNFGSYCFPMLEVFDKYNEGHLYVWPVARRWFNMPRNLTCYSIYGGYYAMGVCKVLFLFINCSLVIGLIFSVRRLNRSYISSIRSKVCLFLFLAFLSNALFSVLAAPSMLRYQIYAMVLGTLLLTLFFSEFKGRIKRAFSY